MLSMSQALIEARQTLDNLSHPLLRAGIENRLNRKKALRERAMYKADCKAFTESGLIEAITETVSRKLHYRYDEICELRNRLSDIEGMGEWRIELFQGGLYIVSRFNSLNPRLVFAAGAEDFELKTLRFCKPSKNKGNLSWG